MVLIITGNAGKISTGHAVATYLSGLIYSAQHQAQIFSAAELPPFNPACTSENTPEVVADFRKLVQQAEYIIFVTPEYIFSLPAILKNLFEWSVATTIFTDKPCACIIAATQGNYALEQLQLILYTLQAKINNRHCLLISGIKGKVRNDEITSASTKTDLQALLSALIKV